MNITRVLCFLVFLSFVYQGCCQSEDCPTFALFVNQTKTGRVIKSKKEWNVTIKHICVTCEISNVKLTCRNLDKSLVRLNTTVISKTRDGNCQLIGGGRFDVYTTFAFTYAWDKINFRPLDFYTYCH